MLTEVAAVRQVPGERHRRWFRAETMDLVVWCDAAGEPVGFQLCYLDAGGEKALTFLPERGLVHRAVDSGEDVPGRHKMTPILVADGSPDVAALRAAFCAQAGGLPAVVVALVDARLQEAALPAG